MMIEIIKIKTSLESPLRKPLNIGDVFFRLTVINKAPNKKRSDGFPIYCVRVKCICGNELIVPEYKLRAKHTKSCGCLQQEIAIKNLSPHIISTHGHSIRSKGKTITREYKAWSGMKQRCSITSGFIFKHYGARGIKVCERWINSFENFFADMGSHPGEGYTLERINANGNYEPSNCKWANYDDQARNRRNNRNVVINGVTMCVSQAVKVINTHESKIIRMVRKLNITHQKAIDLLMLNPRPVNMRQFKEILEKDINRNKE